MISRGKRLINLALKRSELSGNNEDSKTPAPPLRASASDTSSFKRKGFPDILDPRDKVRRTLEWIVEKGNSSIDSSETIEGLHSNPTTENNCLDSSVPTEVLRSPNEVIAAGRENTLKYKKWTSARQYKHSLNVQSRRALEFPSSGSDKNNNAIGRTKADHDMPCPTAVQSPHDVIGSRERKLMSKSDLIPSRNFPSLQHQGTPKNVAAAALVEEELVTKIVAKPSPASEPLAVNQYCLPAVSVHAENSLSDLTNLLPSQNFPSPVHQGTPKNVAAAALVEEELVSKTVAKPSPASEPLAVNQCCLPAASIHAENSLSDLTNTSIPLVRILKDNVPTSSLEVEESTTKIIVEIAPPSQNLAEIQSVPSADAPHAESHQSELTSNAIVYELNKDGDLVQIDDVGQRVVDQNPGGEQMIFEDFPIEEPGTVQNDDEPLVEQEPFAPLQQLTAENINEVLETADNIDQPPETRDTLPRKHTKSPGEWIVNIAKTARRAGKAYTSREGKHFPAKEMKPGCGRSCKFRCYLNVSEDDRQKVKDAYYQRPTPELKWAFIRLNIMESSPKKQDKNNPKRQTSRAYYFHLKGKKVRVCQTMFLSTLVISDTVVRTACRKLGDGGKYSPDKRGGRKPNVISEEVLKSIGDHISTFPRVASHYCRANSSCQYLEEKLNSTANLHRLYLEWMKVNHEGKKCATYHQYTDFFNKLNIKFHRSRKDQCDLCFNWESNQGEKSAEEAKKYEAHILLKDLAQSMKAKDREELAPRDPKVSVCAFDLQKVLNVPHCQASDVYYKRKINLYNFTIYDMGRHAGFCFVWHEGIGKKGANEIASYVLSFVEKKVAEGVTTFIFYSDNCSAQNKNRFLYAMYMLAAAKFKIKIVHRYLVTGHTENEADGMHALIERRSRNENIFTLEQWCAIMEKAKVTGRPYTVKRVTQEDILDFHPLVQRHSSWPAGVRWLEISEIEVNSDQLWMLHIKYDLSDSEAIPVNCKLQSVGRPLCLKSYDPPKAFNGPLPITMLKKKDLDDLCDKSKIIPQESIHFYKSFVTRGQNAMDEEDELYA